MQRLMRSGSGLHGLLRLYGNASLTIRSTLCVAALVLAIAVTAGWFARTALHQSSQSIEETRWRTEVERLALLAARGLDEGVPASDLQETLRRAMDRQLVAACELRRDGEDDALVGVRSPPAFQPVAADTRQVPSHPSHRLWLARAAPLSAGSVVRERRVWLIVFFTGGLSIVLSFLAARSVLDPVHKISQAVQRVSQGHYDTRVKVRNRDEIGILAAAFNRMCRDVAEAQDAMRDLNRGLRQQIKERSQRLQQAFTQLHALEATKDNIQAAFSLQFREPIAHLRRTVARLDQANPGPVALQLVQECGRWNAFVEDILDFVQIESRAESGEDLPRRQEVQPMRCLEDAIGSLRGRLQERGQVVSMECADGVGSVVWEVVRVQKMFRYLLAACARSCRPEGKIAVHLDATGGRVTVSIETSDLAPADPESGPRGVQGIRSRCLGLGVCELLLRDDGGSLSLEEEGPRVRFLLDLPARLDPPPAV